jgi:hypothetical protein
MTMPDPHIPSRLPGQGIGGCLSFALVLGGMVLLLPGLCSLLVMGSLGVRESGGLGLLWLITFLFAGGGVWLIAWAVRNR